MFAVCGTGHAVELPSGEPMPLTLDEAVEIALKQNPEVLKAREEIKRVHGFVVEVRAQALPRASLVGRYNDQDEMLVESLSDQPGLAGAAIGSSSKSYRVAVQASQVLYAGGQVAGALKVADYEQSSSLYSLRDTVDRVIAQVRTQYYQIILNRSLIEVQEETLRLLEGGAEDQRNRYTAGTVPRLNVLRAEVEVANSRPLLIRARNNYRIAQVELTRTLGLDYDGGRGDMLPFKVLGELAARPVTIKLGDAVALAVERRAFLKVQRQMILSEKEQIKIAAAGYKPRIDFNGGYEVRNSSFSEKLDRTVEGWFLGFEGSWAIFDGLETSGKVQQARARFESARINYDDSVRKVEVEVQRAYSSIREAEELIDSQRMNVEQATEALRLASERFDVGAGTQLDLLDSRVSLTRAQLTELEARYDFNIALAEFDRVTGVDTDYDDTFDDPLTHKKKSFRMSRQPKLGNPNW